MNLNLKFFIPESTNGIFRYVYHKSIEKGIGSNVELMCYITMKSDVSTADLAHVSTFTWNSLLETFENYDGAALPAVKKSLRNGINKAQEILKNNKDIVENGIDFEISLIALIDRNIYIALIGDHTINIFRDEEVHLISEMLNSHKVNSGSIAIFPSDVIAITDNPKNFNWESPRSLLTDLNDRLIDGKLKYGSVFASEQVDLEELIGLTSVVSPYDLTNLVEENAEEDAEENAEESSTVIFEEIPVEDGSVINDSEIEASSSVDQLDEESLNRKDIAKASQTKSKTLVKKNSMESNIKKNKLVQISSKLKQYFKSVAPIIKKILTFLQKVWRYIAKYFIKFIELLSKLFSSIRKVVGLLLSNQFGNQPWFKRIQAKISQNELGGKPSLGHIKMGGMNSSDLKNKRAAIFITVIIGVIVIIVGVNKTKEAKLTKEIHEGYIAFELKVNDYITTAEGEVNSDSNSALKSLFEANQLVNNPTIDMTLISVADQKKFKELRNKILSVEDILYNRTAVSKSSGMELFVDGKLKFGDATDATDIAIYKDPTLVEYLYITDKGIDALFWVTTAGKVRMVDNNGVDIKDPLFVDTGTMGMYIYDKKLGAIRAPFDGKSGEVTGLEQLSGASPDAFGVDDPQEMAIFTSLDNIYILSRSKQAIMKSKGSINTAYGLPYTYFSDESLSTVNDIFGDLMIYLLTAGSDGLGTYQYNNLEGRFKAKDIQVISPENAFENLTAGYTAGTMDKHLYVFDSVGKRVLVFEKPMDDLHANSLLFLKEYVYRGEDESIWSNVKDIVVDSSETYLYVLDGSNIWKVQL